MEFLRKYGKSIVIGSFVTVSLIAILASISFLIIGPHWGENILIFTFWGAFISFLVHHRSYFFTYQRQVLQVLGLIMVVILAIVVDEFWGIPNNPITIPLIILFWLGLAYVLLPDFFKKYRIPILTVYGLLTSAFLILRTQANYQEDYHEIIVNLILIPIPILIILWIYEQWRNIRNLKEAKTNAELALLKSQINPHFFFNTLNNLYGLVVENSSHAPEVVLKLSDMMRYTIYDGKEETVPLSQEISYLRNYIDLHKIRYQKKVDITFDIDVYKDIQIAPLLFIILLENAFKHGVESMTDGAYIHMKLESKQGAIRFSIENNFEPQDATEVRGIGLENLRKRLDLIYPDKYDLMIEKEDSRYTTSLNIETT